MAMIRDIERQRAAKCPLTVKTAHNRNRRRKHTIHNYDDDDDDADIGQLLTAGWNGQRNRCNGQAAAVAAEWSWAAAKCHITWGFFVWCTELYLSSLFFFWEKDACMRTQPSFVYSLAEVTANMVGAWWVVIRSFVRQLHQQLTVSDGTRWMPDDELHSSCHYCRLANPNNPTAATKP